MGLFFWIFSSSLAFAHGGRTDSRGGHNSSSGYHYHSSSSESYYTVRFEICGEVPNERDALEECLDKLETAYELSYGNKKNEVKGAIQEVSFKVEMAKAKQISDGVLVVGGVIIVVYLIATLFQ